MSLRLLCLATCCKLLWFQMSLCTDREKKSFTASSLCFFFSPAILLCVNVSGTHALWENVSKIHSCCYWTEVCSHLQSSGVNIGCHGDTMTSKKYAGWITGWCRCVGSEWNEGVSGMCLHSSQVGQKKVKQGAANCSFQCFCAFTVYSDAINFFPMNSTYLMFWINLYILGK